MIDLRVAFSLRRLAWVRLLLTFAVTWLAGSLAPAQDGALEKTLRAQDSQHLSSRVESEGDARRGAIIFHQPFLACTTCHGTQPKSARLGPSLFEKRSHATTEYLIESLLEPSRHVAPEFRTTVILTTAGKTLNGIVAREDEQSVVLKDLDRQGQETVIAKSEIDQRKQSPTSLMPAGQMNLLASEQQFFDLVKYLREVAVEGPERADALRPPANLFAVRALPEYESRIDHAGMIKSLDQESLARGEAIYQRLCINCHGTVDQPGSLPTSLRFASGKFKNGNDPYTMYQTLTRGFGMMVAQTWMVPQQKYDVIHYIREAYLRPHNSSQWFPITDPYLDSLPKGDTRGPAPRKIEPWAQMDYGPYLFNTYEVGDDAHNFAYKGIAVRLDAGPGGVARGRHWMLYDHDTMRVAAAWSGAGFVDWNGIHFNGRHQIHPRIVGSVEFENGNGPGWANPETGDFDDLRIVGRDGRRYGPLPSNWVHYRGLYRFQQQVVIDYTVGTTEIQESPGWSAQAGHDVFTRTMNVGPRKRPLTLRLSQEPGGALLEPLEADPRAGQTWVVGVNSSPQSNQPAPSSASKLDGATYLEADPGDLLDMTNRDFTVVARIRTKQGGTIFSKTSREANWAPNGKTFFVRGGRLCYDIGWVGVVNSQPRVDDGSWHDVAVSYLAETGQVTLYVDGKMAGRKSLKPKGPVEDQVARIGFTNENFPKNSFFQGEIDSVAFYQQGHDGNALDVATFKTQSRRARWDLSQLNQGSVDAAGNSSLSARLVQRDAAKRSHSPLLLGIAPRTANLVPELMPNGEIRVHLPPGDKPLLFTLWQTRLQPKANPVDVANQLVWEEPARSLRPRMAGGPQHWPEVLTTNTLFGNRDGAFRVDVLDFPDPNPWLCRMRLTGFDFVDQGRAAYVCTWDGDVWYVQGLRNPEGQLTWKRVASGLFQPLGLKIVRDQIYVTCRDQLAILEDLNGDGEFDRLINFNNDHQVTEHFHEFAMGLQVDEAGNFYYAKSARHALPALVPHHGTLLRVSADGTRTDILANGFRAANGVCLNPDGSFIVTDQEGHWNPKNRINWVRPGGFYGNMFGYHDVQDSSDSAMQDPLCWITNAFDRSPAELLWVESQAWGNLNGALLNLSYGYGKVFIVPFEKLGERTQGGMCELPLPQFPTGLIRGRFSPADQQLYCCGMFAWAGSQQQPGGFYRINYQGENACVPTAIKATAAGLEVEFSDPVRLPPGDGAKHVRIKAWDLKRTANYGSKHFNERELEVTSVRTTASGSSLVIEVRDMPLSWGMEVKLDLLDREGRPISRVIHNSVFEFGPERSKSLSAR